MNHPSAGRRHGDAVALYLTIGHAVVNTPGDKNGGRRSTIATSICHKIRLRPWQSNARNPHSRPDGARRSSVTAHGGGPGNNRLEIKQGTFELRFDPLDVKAIRFRPAGGR